MVGAARNRAPVLPQQHHHHEQRRPHLEEGGRTDEPAAEHLPASASAGEAGDGDGRRHEIEAVHEEREQRRAQHRVDEGGAARPGPPQGEREHEVGERIEPHESLHQRRQTALADGAHPQHRERRVLHPEVAARRARRQRDLLEAVRVALQGVAVMAELRLQQRHDGNEHVDEHERGEQQTAPLRDGGAQPLAQRVEAAHRHPIGRPSPPLEHTRTISSQPEC